MSDMNIQVVDFQATSAPAEFTLSLKDTGFAVLTNHPINFDLEMLFMGNGRFFSVQILNMSTNLILKNKTDIFLLGKKMQKGIPRKI